MSFLPKHMKGGDLKTLDPSHGGKASPNQCLASARCSKSTER